MATPSKPATGPITTDDLHAYADNALPHARAVEVEAYLATNPADAAKVADYRLLNRAIRAGADEAPTDTIPLEMLRTVRRRPRLAARPIAAALSWLLIGGGLGWLVGDWVEPGRGAIDRLARDAGTAYAVYAPERLHPVEVGAADSDHLATWLSNRLGMSVPIPSLADLGFTFLGGRLLAGEDTPAALLMYQDDAGRRITLYVTNALPPDRSRPMEFRPADTAGVVTWASGGAGFGLAGGVPEAALMAAAGLIRAQFPS